MNFYEFVNYLPAFKFVGVAEYRTGLQTAIV